MDWRTMAACQNQDPELFFPTGTTAAASQQAAVAKEVSARCPETDACQEWATATKQQHGVWGGYDEFERRALGRAGRTHVLDQRQPTINALPDGLREADGRSFPRSVTDVPPGVPV